MVKFDHARHSTRPPERRGEKAVKSRVSTNGIGVTGERPGRLLLVDTSCCHSWDRYAERVCAVYIVYYVGRSVTRVVATGLFAGRNADGPGHPSRWNPGKRAFSPLSGFGSKSFGRMALVLPSMVELRCHHPALRGARTVAADCSLCRE